MASDKVFTINRQTNDWLLYKYPPTSFTQSTKLSVLSYQKCLIFVNGKMEKEVSSGDYSLVKTLPVHEIKNKKIELYFLNTRLILDTFWGTTRPITVLDSTINSTINVRARGTMKISVLNMSDFIINASSSILKNNFVSLKGIQSFVREHVNNSLITIVNTIFNQTKAGFKDLMTKTIQIQETVKTEVNSTLKQFGLELSSFTIESFNLNALESAKYENASNVNTNSENKTNVVNVESKMVDSISTHKCVSCGKDIPQGVLFCPYCGAKQEKYCKKCGNKIASDALFCSSCGEKNN